MSYLISPEIELKYMTELVFFAIQKHSQGEWVSKAQALKKIPSMRHWTLDEILVRLKEERLIEIMPRGTKYFSIRSTTRKQKVPQPDELRGIRRVVLSAIEKCSQGKWIFSEATVAEFPEIHDLRCDDTLLYLVDKGFIMTVPMRGKNGFLIRSTTTLERKKQ